MLAMGLKLNFTKEIMREPLKYIIIENTGIENAVVFNSILSHADVGFRYARTVISAGFCTLPDKLNNHVSVWGKSTTLGIESREEDAAIIQKQFFGITNPDSESVPNEPSPTAEGANLPPKKDLFVC